MKKLLLKILKKIFSTEVKYQSPTPIRNNLIGAWKSKQRRKARGLD